MTVYTGTVDDASFMQRCLELAAKGRGKVGTNPLVGAVLVRDEKIITEAWHEEFGEQQIKIKVGSTRSTEIGFSFKAKEKAN